MVISSFVIIKLHDLPYVSPIIDSLLAGSSIYLFGSILTFQFKF